MECEGLRSLTWKTGVKSTPLWTHGEFLDFHQCNTDVSQRTFVHKHLLTRQSARKRGDGTSGGRNSECRCGWMLHVLEDGEIRVRNELTPAPEYLSPLSILYLQSHRVASFFTFTSALAFAVPNFQNDWITIDDLNAMISRRRGPCNTSGWRNWHCQTPIHFWRFSSSPTDRSEMCPSVWFSLSQTFAAVTIVKSMKSPSTQSLTVELWRITIK
jgi:hypothetical protein